MLQRLQDNDYKHSVSLPNYDSDTFNVTIYIDQLAQQKLIHFGEKGIEDHTSAAVILEYHKMKKLKPKVDPVPKHLKAFMGICCVKFGYESSKGWLCQHIKNQCLRNNILVYRMLMKINKEEGNDEKAAELKEQKKKKKQELKKQLESQKMENGKSIEEIKEEEKEEEEKQLDQLDTQDNSDDAEEKKAL